MPFCFQQGWAEHRPCGQGAGLCPPGLGHLTPRGCLCVVVGVAGAVWRPAPPRLPQQRADPVLGPGRPAPVLLPRLFQASVFSGRWLAWKSTRTGLPRVAGFLQVWRVLGTPTSTLYLTGPVTGVQRGWIMREWSSLWSHRQDLGLGRSQMTPVVPGPVSLRRGSRSPDPPLPPSLDPSSSLGQRVDGRWGHL